ncbi:hypothetical protein [Nocardia thailandica]
MRWTNAVLTVDPSGAGRRCSTVVRRAACPNLRVNQLLADALDEGCAGDGLAAVAATVYGLADRLQCQLHEWVPGGVLPQAIIVCVHQLRAAGCCCCSTRRRRSRNSSTTPIVTRLSERVAGGQRLRSAGAVSARCACC